MYPKIGWVFVSTSPEKIDVRYIFGMSDSVTADELVLEVGPTDVESEGDLFVTDDAKSANQDAGGEQYAILIVIVIAAIVQHYFILKDIDVIAKLSKLLRRKQ